MYCTVYKYDSTVDISHMIKNAHVTAMLLAAN